MSKEENDNEENKEDKKMIDLRENKGSMTIPGIVPKAYVEDESIEYKILDNYHLVMILNQKL